jgi:tetratricopeptide (TPR) repeat protein
MKYVFIFLTVVIFAGVFTSGCKSHKSISNATDTTNTFTAADYLKEGDLQLNLKNYKDALKQYNKAIDLDAYNGEAFAGRGLVKYFLKDYKGAIEDFNASIVLIPDFAEVYDWRGIAKGELDDKVGACEDWNQAFVLGFNPAYRLIEEFCLEENK